MKLLFALFAISLLLYGCDSKFVETSPNSVKIKGSSLKQRISQKKKIDRRMNDIDSGAQKIKRIIKMFGKIQNPSSKEDVYTPIDFLIDVNSELKNKLPVKNGDQVIRRALVEIPIKGLSDECRYVESILKTSLIYAKDAPKTPKNVIGERLSYSFKSCNSEGKYLSAIEADWTDSSLEFRIKNRNIEKVFENILIKEAMNVTKCRVVNDSHKLLDSIYCENLEIKLSKSEVAFVKEIYFQNNGEIRFKSDADIYENNNKKGHSIITVLSNGDIDINYTKEKR